MRMGIVRVLFVAAAGLWLAGCSAGKFSNPFESTTPGADALAAAPANDVTADEPLPSVLGVPASAQPGLLGSDPNDFLSLGKKHYRANNFGLAASYDRLRRFDLADRAYNQAIGILGPTTEILNNHGYSYMLRGDYKHAREKLAAAQRRDPGNKYVQNNLQLLEDSYRKGKAIE